MNGVDVHAILRMAEEQKAERALQLPTEQDCIRMMIQCRQRLIELGWNDATYAPKDGSKFDAITAGFTGPSPCSYLGEFPNGAYFIEDGGDWWPVKPTLFKLMEKQHAQ